MATDQPLHVLLEGRVIASLRRDTQWQLRLGYEQEYINDPTATPLSLSLPREIHRHDDSKVSPWLWNLLPDNDAVLTRWSRQFGVTTASPFGLLSSQVGHDCAGAVQFAADDAIDELLDRGERIDWLTDADVAARLRELSKDTTAWLGPGFTGQFSLGGAQAKTALLRSPDYGWGLPYGASPTTHILKPAIAGFEAQDLNEHLCLSAARALSLDAAHSEIVRFEDQTAISVRRYDRQPADDGFRRIHQEDMCQATGRPPAAKYQNEGGPSPTDIVEVFRNTMTPQAADAAIDRFVDALLFNWLIAGTDAHAKNYSLLLSGPRVQLAPLYDITSYLPYDDSRGRKVALAMSVGDDYKLPRTDSRRAWEKAARAMHIDAGRLLARADELARTIGDAFVQSIDEDVKALGSPLPARLADLVAQRAAHCQRALAAGAS